MTFSSGGSSIAAVVVVAAAVVVVVVVVAAAAAVVVAVLVDNVAVEIAFVPDGGFSLRIWNPNKAQDAATAADQLVIDCRWIVSSDGEICGYHYDSYQVGSKQTDGAYAEL